MSFIESIITQNPVSVNIQFEDNSEISDEEKFKIEQRKKRVNMCGRRIASGHRADIGRYVQYVYRCGVWRNCPLCLNDRVSKYFNEIKTACDQYGELCAAIVNTKLARKMADYYGRSRYRRFPIGNDLEVIFYAHAHNDLYESMGITFTFDEFDNLGLPWKNIVYQPEGKRVSGGLGVAAKAPQEGLEKIQVEYTITNAPAEARQVAADKALQDTIELDPQTPKDCEACLDIRNGRYRHHLLDMGYTIDLVFYRNEMCDPTKLNWQGGATMTLQPATDKERFDGLPEGEREKYLPQSQIRQLRKSA